MKKVRKLKITDEETDIRIEVRQQAAVILDEDGKEKELLFQMLESYLDHGNSNKPNLTCNTEWIILKGADWKNEICSISGGIIIADAEKSYVDTTEFRDAVLATNNFILIFARQLLKTFPEGTDAMYRMNIFGMIHRMKPLYRVYYGYLFVDNKPRKQFSDLYTNSRAQILAEYLIDEPIIKHYGADIDAIISWIRAHMDSEKIWVIVREETNGVKANYLIAFHEKFPQQILVSLVWHLRYELYGDSYCAQPWVNGKNLEGTVWEKWFRDRVLDKYRDLPKEERDVFYTMENVKEGIAFVYIF